MFTPSHLMSAYVVPEAGNGSCELCPICGVFLHLQVCVSKFMSFHDRQYNLTNIGGNDPEANCTMLHGMLSARCGCSQNVFTSWTADACFIHDASRCVTDGILRSRAFRNGI